MEMFFGSLPSPYPSARKRASGTDWAKLCRAFGALCMGSPGEHGLLWHPTNSVDRSCCSACRLLSAAPSAPCAWAALESMDDYGIPQQRRSTLLLCVPGYSQPRLRRSVHGQPWRAWTIMASHKQRTSTLLLFVWATLSRAFGALCMGSPGERGRLWHATKQRRSTLLLCVPAILSRAFGALCMGSSGERGRLWHSTNSVDRSCCSACRLLSAAPSALLRLASR
jgi:hypothetical protein